MDVFEFPRPGNKVVEVFRASDSTGTTPNWMAYHRPRGATFCSLAVAGGAGSGAGALGAAASTGAGGGGSSSLTRALFLWDTLPEVLYLLVGRGGAAVGTNTAGNAGQLSYVCACPQNASASDRILVSGAAAAGGGAIAATGGSAGTAAATANCSLSSWALSFISIVGIIGTAGGASSGAAGTAFSLGAGNIQSPFIPGTGGGGVTTTDFAGGAISAAGGWPGLVGGAAGGGRGQNGYAPNMAFGVRYMGLSPLYYGGTGGGTLDAGTGGAGGDGALGSGGGGGGGGTTGGGGGKGGDGIIVIASW